MPFQQQHSGNDCCHDGPVTKEQEPDHLFNKEVPPPTTHTHTRIHAVVKKAGFYHADALRAFKQAVKTLNMSKRQAAGS